MTVMSTTRDACFVQIVYTKLCFIVERHCSGRCASVVVDTFTRSERVWHSRPGTVCMVQN